MEEYIPLQGKNIYPYNGRIYTPAKYTFRHSSTQFCANSSISGAPVLLNILPILKI